MLSPIAWLVNPPKSSSTHTEPASRSPKPMLLLEIPRDLGGAYRPWASYNYPMCRIGTDGLLLRCQLKHMFQQ
jgi:hypothetical protein